MPPQFLGNPFDQGEWGPDDFDVDDDWISFNNEAGREFGFIVPDGMHINEDDDDGYSVGSNDEFGEEEFFEVEEETDSNLALDGHEESHSPPVIYSMCEHECEFFVEVDDPNESLSISIYTMSEDKRDYIVEIDDPNKSPSLSIYTLSEDDNYDYNLVLDEPEESNSPSQSFAEAASRHLEVAVIDKGREFGFIITDVRHVNDDDDDGYYLGSNDEFDFGEEEYLEVEEETDSNPPVDEHEESQSPSIIYSMSEDEYDYNVELDDPDESRSLSMYTMSEDDYYDYNVVLGEPEASRSPSIFTMSEDDDCDVPSDCFSYGSEEILHTKEDSPKVAESNSSTDSTNC
ncbi:uncharacterized protein [Diabrotica undecimpunctata]|uniref:uncharacterized protein n=1 Tax=Diabrotica undecimpunctata TaxID=50387 RepID=UPI003B63820F